MSSLLNRRVAAGTCPRACVQRGRGRLCVMAASKSLQFAKYQGLGNDFVLVRLEWARRP